MAVITMNTTRFIPVRRKLLLLLLFICVISAASVHAQDSGSLIFLAPPAVVNDQVILQMIVRGAGLQRYDLLTAANFRLNEATDQVLVSSEPSASMAMVVMVNLGYASDVDLIRSTLRAYFDTYYRSGDEIIFFVFGDNLLETFEPEDQAAIRSLIDGLTASSLYSPIAPMVTIAVDRVRAELAENPARAFQAMLVGSYVLAADDPAMASGFAALDVPLHVIQAHRFRDDSTAQLRAFTENGGGVFVNNLGGRFVQTDDTINALSTLELAYDALDSSRTVYTLSYHPLRRDLNAEPEVTLNLQLEADQQISANFTYQRTFAPPQVELASDSLNLRRIPRYAADEIVFDTSAYQLNARVLFPDDVSRDVQSVRVEIINAADDEVLQSALDLDPDIDPLGYFDVNLSLEGFTLPDTVTPFRLVVTVTDELGLVGTVEREGRVTVGALPALPTLTPVPTIPPTVTPAPSPTITAEPQPVVTVTQSLPSVNDTPVVYLFSGIILFLVMIILMMLITLRRARRQRTIPGYGQDMDTDAGQPTSQGTAVNPAPALPATSVPVENKLYGRLIVVKGLNQTEIPITREEFVIGRSVTDNCDYVIAEPYISPRHCMLIHRNGRFAIRDLKAKNGVFVNGERIPIERDVIVPIGSEVSITQNIIVELWDPTTIVNTNRSRQATATQTQQSQVTGSEHLFRPLLGIRYVDDEEEVSDDYSPL